MIAKGILLACDLRKMRALSSPGSLLATIEQLKPDVIVIDTDSPSRDVLEHLVVLTQHTPRPVVMFSSDGAPDQQLIDAADLLGARPLLVHCNSALSTKKSP